MVKLLKIVLAWYTVKIMAWFLGAALFLLWVSS
jgi:hypothetical protein